MAAEVAHWSVQPLLWGGGLLYKGHNVMDSIVTRCVNQLFTHSRGTRGVNGPSKTSGWSEGAGGADKNKVS